MALLLGSAILGGFHVKLFKSWASGSRKKKFTEDGRNQFTIAHIESLA